MRQYGFTLKKKHIWSDKPQTKSEADATENTLLGKSASMLRSIRSRLLLPKLQGQFSLVQGSAMPKSMLTVRWARRNGPTGVHDFHTEAPRGSLSDLAVPSGISNVRLQ